MDIDSYTLRYEISYLEMASRYDTLLFSYELLGKFISCVQKSAPKINLSAIRPPDLSCVG
jgi:hypothetical protein